jgi:UDP-glucose 4-epimerase
MNFIREEKILDYLNKNKFIVIGNGFIGKNLNIYFEKIGCEVINLKNSYLKFNTEQFNIDSFNRIDYSDHILIFTVGIKRQHGDNIEIFNQNIIINKNLETLINTIKFKHIIYLSSLSVYGDNLDHNHLTEQDDTFQNTYYGKSKFIAEQILLKSNINNLTILRLPLVYGNFDNSLSYGPTLFRHLLKKQLPIYIYGDGTELREFLYIKVLSNFVHYLSNCKYKPPIINLVSGKSHSFINILNLLKPKQLKIIPVFKERSKPLCNQTYTKSSFLNDFIYPSLEDSLLEFNLDYHE